jgi:hypothetical protein
MTAPMVIGHRGDFWSFPFKLADVPRLTASEQGTPVEETPAEERSAEEAPVAKILTEEAMVGSCRRIS